MEATVHSASKDWPLLLNCFPVQQTLGPTMLEFFQHSLRSLNQEERKRIVICADGYYIDKRSKKWLREQQIKYLVGVNSHHFHQLWARLALTVDDIGKWAVAWSWKTEKAALMHWHPTLGRKCLLTTAFKYEDHGQALDQPSFEAYYKVIFNETDTLNHHLHGKTWPYHRPGLAV